MLITTRWIASIVLFCCIVPATRAQLSTSLIIRSGMVMQRELDIPMWGTAGNGIKVIAELNGLKDSTIATSEGTWELTLPAMSAGGPYELTLQAGEDTLFYTDVYIGDVWLASGQSNMAMELKDSDNASQEIAGSDNPEIRQFNIAKSLGNTQKDKLPAGSEWTPATPAHVGEFTAVGYYFARYLYKHLEVPVGIINSSYGGTRIESWMSEEMLGYDEQDIVLGDGASWLQPTVAYNVMLHPLLRFPIKGVIWYQGESNAGSRETALMYTGQLNKLITSWRELWGLGDIPFLWVQLPNYSTEANENYPGTWDALPMLRAAQSRVLALPNTGEAITIDTGEPDIHPTNKEPVGKRLSLLAQVVAYDDTVVSSGPRYLSHGKLENGIVEITFDHRGSGLVARETEDNSLRWFSIASSSGTFYKASAKIDSKRVLVWNNSIPNPEYIRYAWEYNPFNVNFYNEEGLPAAPFKIQVSNPGFRIHSFKPTAYAIDKGESVIFTWQVNEAENVSINHLELDTIGGIRVWPSSDSTFTLLAHSKDHPGQADSVSIRILVKEPVPTISIRTDAGGLIPTGGPVTIFASVSAPNGGTISGVEFFVNSIKFDSLTDAPYETIWIPDSSGSYHITGMISNHVGDKQYSDTIHFVAARLLTMLYEAENASISGGKWILEDDNASGAKYVELTRDWNISFDSVAVEKNGDYQLSIGFMLNFGSPKIQHLYLNGEYSSALTFESRNEDSWDKHHIMIPLNEGNNQIAIQSLWGLMSMDYISLLFKEYETEITSLEKFQSEEILKPIYPNPFSTSTLIQFTLPEKGHTRIAVYDLSGRNKGIIVDRELNSGTHSFSYGSAELEDGMYLLRFTYKNRSILKKMMKM